MNNKIKKLFMMCAVAFAIGTLFTGCRDRKIKLNDKGVALVGEHLVKPETELREAGIEKAVKRFGLIYEKYLSASKGRIYLSVIPDKGYYLAKDNNLEIMNYDKVFEIMSAPDWYTYIDISSKLELDSYYRTDSHWKQECILPVAELICESMGVEAFAEGDFDQEEVADFQGIYVKDYGTGLENDKIVIMSNPTIEQCAVTGIENTDVTSVYDMSKKDDAENSYDIYLSGAKAVEYIENKEGKPEKELIVFRDSYGSSLVPLLLKDYSKVTLIDIRYVMTDLLGDYVDFHGQDVLFIYSTPVLQRSSVFK